MLPQSPVVEALQTQSRDTKESRPCLSLSFFSQPRFCPIAEQNPVPGKAYKGVRSLTILIIMVIEIHEGGNAGRRRVSVKSYPKNEYRP